MYPESPIIVVESFLFSGSKMAINKVLDPFSVVLLLASSSISFGVAFGFSS
jgi:hypothetical protein